MEGKNGLWPLEVVLQVDDGKATVVVAGELDVFSLAEFNDAIDEAGQSAVDTLVIDLSDVSFIGRRAISRLVELAHESRDQGVGFAIQNPSQAVKRAQTLLGVDDTDLPLEQFPRI
jgi:anti-anti-sigma factor